MTKIDFEKDALKRRIAKESAIFAKSIFRTSKETHEDVVRDIENILKCAYSGSKVEIGFIAFELHAHYRIPHNKALTMAKTMAARIEE